MILPACIFTYSGDAAAVPWCVLGALAAVLVPIVVEDAAAPLPPHTAGFLRRRGVTLWRSEFPRRGNLNGTDCAAGICRTLARAGRLHDGHALKLDTDTVVLRPELFLSDPAAAMVALTSDERPDGYGMAYRIRADVAAKLAGLLDSQPLDPTAPEDLTICREVAKLWRVTKRDFTPESGPFSSLPHDGDATDFARRFDVLSVGNPPLGGWRDRVREVAGKLREIALNSGF